VSFDFQSAYDELNPADDDYWFYAALAASVGVSRAVDLGCWPFRAPGGGKHGLGN
jgi:hypothetical protein